MSVNVKGSSGGYNCHCLSCGPKGHSLVHAQHLADSQRQARNYNLLESFLLTLDLVSCGLEKLHTVISRPIGLGGTRNAGVDSDYGDAHSGNDGPARVGHGPYDGPLIVCLCEAERV